jgi:hypothetical protein
MCCVGRVVSKLYARQKVLSLIPTDRRGWFVLANYFFSIADLLVSN